MSTRRAVVAATVGLHARPAAVFVRAVTSTGLPITLARPGEPAVDARSLLEVMTADFNCGCEVELGVAGSGHDTDTVERALDRLAALLRTDLATDQINVEEGR